MSPDLVLAGSDVERVEQIPPATSSRWARRSTWAAVALVVAAGVVLRTYTASALWLDEAISVSISSLPLPDVDDALRRDGAPPLYPLILWGWEQFFGDGQNAVRALSAVFGIAALPVIAVAGRRLAGEAGAMASLLLLAVSPFAVYYSTEARMYSLVVLLVLLGFLALDGYLRAPGRVRGIAVALLSGTLALTHYWALFLLSTVAGALLLRRWREGRRTDARAAGWMITGGFLFLPWLPSFLFHVRHTGTPWSEPPSLSDLPDLVKVPVRWASGPGQAGSGAVLLALVLLLLAVLGSTTVRLSRAAFELDLRGRPPGRGLAIIIAATLVLALVISRTMGGAFVARYTSVVFPIFILLAAVGAARLPFRVRTPVLIVAALLGLALALPNLTNSGKTQAPVLAAALRAEAMPGDVVVYCPDQLGPAVSRLLPAGLHQEVYPGGGEPARVDWVDYQARNLNADPVQYARRLSERAGDRVIWLVSHAGYRTYEGHCQTLVHELTTLRGQPLCLVESDGYYLERADVRGWATAAEPRSALAERPQDCAPDQVPFGVVEP
ncbi:glycosyltransferase family 39 protein [Geodermatophilus chilensis]|uniref:glycosyltransferase family 39 protein n=1 Tax=Geodermatophilus chilensis TaxID=2035835 RepID=UPI000C25C549|nr:glycosyltransferase family 39 protein [Geodermatophilus chilensis]